jgi:transposase
MASNAHCPHLSLIAGRWQGPRARYHGNRKNLVDLRRCVVIHNVHVLQRTPLAQVA